MNNYFFRKHVLSEDKTCISESVMCTFWLKTTAAILKPELRWFTRVLCTLNTNKTRNHRNVACRKTFIQPHELQVNGSKSNYVHSITIITTLLAQERI